MDVLTRERAKPALPFAGTHRLIDFPLSALVASQVTDVWVSVQYQSSTLDAYLAGGRPWDLDRTRGGFRRITPEQGSGGPHDDGFSHGNADGLFRLRDSIAEFDADVLIVMSADHVFSTDLRPIISRHLERGAECTIVTAQVGVREATHNMVVEVGADNSVAAVHYKPDQASDGTVAVEIFLYQPSVMIEVLEALRHSLQGEAEDDRDTGLGDFGEHLIPALVRRGRVYADPIEGYWKDVGRPEAYLQAHRDLLAGRIDVFDHPTRPILSPGVVGPPAWFGPHASVNEAMVGPASRIRGTIRRSVIGPGVDVHTGALIEDSVLVGDTVVEAGAQVRSSVIDAGARIGRDARVGAAPAATQLTAESITLVGLDCTVGRGVVVAPGSRLEPGTKA